VPVWYYVGFDSQPGTYFSLFKPYKMSTLRQRLERDAEKERIPASVLPWLLEYIDQFPERTWNQPDNRKGNDDFDKAKMLHSLGYTVMRSRPIWADGFFRGYDIRFWHSEEMIFPKEEF